MLVVRGVKIGFHDRHVYANALYYMNVDGWICGEGKEGEEVGMGAVSSSF